MRKNILYPFTLEGFCATLMARFLLRSKQPVYQFSITANEPVGQLGLDNLNHVLANKIGNSFFTDGFLHRNAASVFLNKVNRQVRKTFAAGIVFCKDLSSTIFFDTPSYHFSTKLFVTCVNRN